MSETPPRRRRAERVVQPEQVPPAALPPRKPLIRVEVDREGLAAFDRRALLTHLLVGLLAGWLASWVVGGSGLLRYAITGIAGSFLGSYLLEKLGVDLGLRSPLANRIATATIGAALVVVLARLLA